MINYDTYVLVITMLESNFTIAENLWEWPQIGNQVRVLGGPQFWNLN